MAGLEGKAELCLQNIDPEILKRTDVVITTYDVLRSEHKVYSGTATKSKTQAAKQHEDNSGSDDSLLGKSLPKKNAKRAPKAKAKLCALYDIQFWRVVLGTTPRMVFPHSIHANICPDEAQAIKNRTSKTAQGSFALNSKYRWVLTGTPIQVSDTSQHFDNFYRHGPIEQGGRVVFTVPIPSCSSVERLGQLQNYHRKSGQRGKVQECYEKTSCECHDRQLK